MFINMYAPVESTKREAAKKPKAASPVDGVARVVTSNGDGRISSGSLDLRYVTVMANGQLGKAFLTYEDLQRAEDEAGSAFQWYVAACELCADGKSVMPQPASVTVPLLEKENRHELMDKVYGIEEYRKTKVPAVVADPSATSESAPAPVTDASSTNVRQTLELFAAILGVSPQGPDSGSEEERQFLGKLGLNVPTKTISESKLAELIYKKIKRLKELASTAETAESRLKQLEAANERLTRENEEFKTDAQELIAAKTEAEKSAKLFHNRCKRLEDEQKALSQEKDEAEKQAVGLEKEVGKLQARISDLELEIVRAERKNVGLEDKVTELKGKLTKSEEKVTELEGELTESQETVKKLQEEKKEASKRRKFGDDYDPNFDPKSGSGSGSGGGTSA